MQVLASAVAPLFASLSGTITQLQPAAAAATGADDDEDADSDAETEAGAPVAARGKVTRRVHPPRDVTRRCRDCPCTHVHAASLSWLLYLYVCVCLYHLTLYVCVCPCVQVYCAATRLARLLFVLGQGALSSLVYTEQLADAAKKFADKQPSPDAAPAASEAAPAKGKKGRGAAAAAAAAGSAEGGEGADAMEEEMGMAAAADADHERLFHLVTPPSPFHLTSLFSSSSSVPR